MKTLRTTLFSVASTIESSIGGVLLRRLSLVVLFVLASSCSLIDGVFDDETNKKKAPPQPDGEIESSPKPLPQEDAIVHEIPVIPVGAPGYESLSIDTKKALWQLHNVGRDVEKIFYLQNGSIHLRIKEIFEQILLNDSDIPGSIKMKLLPYAEGFWIHHGNRRQIEVVVSR